MGRTILLLWRETGRAFLVTLAGFANFPYAFSRRNRAEVGYQMFFTGIRSLGVITVVALFTGMIFALQTGIELRRYGQEEYVGGGVTVTMLREMGPFMTAMIIAASVGSSIAAQLGIAPETLSRVLRQLRERSLISGSGRVLNLVDLNGLRALAGV